MLLSVCAVLSSCSGKHVDDGFLRALPSASDGRVYHVEYGGDDDSRMRSPLAVVDFTGAAEVVEFEPRGVGYYAKVRTGQWRTELEWAERPICVLVDPGMNLFVSELPLSKHEDSSERLFSVFGSLLSTDPREVDSRNIYQRWRESFGDPTLGSCRVRLSAYEDTSWRTRKSDSSPGFRIFFYGTYGASVGGTGVSVPCQYFDSAYQNGERWAVLNFPYGVFRLRWRSGILLLDMSDNGDLLAMLVDTKGENMTLREASKAGLIPDKEPGSPVHEVEGLGVEELSGKPLVFLR
jgi:hypothetical protein